MNCPICGAVNSSGRATCYKCGKALNPLIASNLTRRDSSMQSQSATKPESESYARKGSFTHDEIVKKMKMDYSYAHGDATNRALEGITGLAAQWMSTDIDLQAFLKDAAEIIQRCFGLREVSVGLKDPDGLYRYHIMTGFREDAEIAMRRLAYSRDLFDDNPQYKGTMISKYTKVFLAEDLPFKEDERDTYSRQILLDTLRHSPTESLEGDYLNTHIYGKGDDILGWVETSGTRTGKFPDVTSIKWIELVAQIIGLVITNRNVRRG